MCIARENCEGCEYYAGTWRDVCPECGQEIEEGCEAECLAEVDGTEPYLWDETQGRLFE